MTMDEKYRSWLRLVHGRNTTPKALVFKRDQACRKARVVKAAILHQQPNNLAMQVPTR